MPINGGTRMLRARRKDINVKPNRRLDRKSSRGMLFENEELRMRTITINAEVEQGQHALKKLRRENEQLRREMWSLRDEYDKMEKLLRKKETDEDSDQENSYSDDNYSQSETDEDAGEVPPSDAKFGNASTARAFDGLSVIDEQTEETTTQTTESVVGTGSRSNSANRVGIRMYEEGGSDFLPFLEYPYRQQRKKSDFDSSAFPGFGTDWPDNGYTVRPASPYPYPESIQPSYQKRFQVIQNLPPPVTVDSNGWIFPRVQGSDAFLLPDKPRDHDYNVIRDRTGPDVFIGTDVIQNVKAEMDKIEIGEKAEGEGGEAIRSKEVPVEEKLTTERQGETSDSEKFRGHVQESVPCQNSNCKDVEDMARTDTTFQSKLMVTLKTPGIAKKTFQPYPAAYGIRPEYQARRYPTFPVTTGNDPQELPSSTADPAITTEDIPLQDGLGLGLLTEPEMALPPPLKPIKIPPAPPPRTTSCLGTIIPESPIGIPAVHHRTFRRAKSPTIHEMQNPLMLSEPMATSSPTISLLQRGPNLSLDNLSRHRFRSGLPANEESSTEDVSGIRKCVRRETPHLNKSVSSPSFGTFLRRKPSEHSVSSMDIGKTPRGAMQNNVSISSSSGLDSPVKSERRKRRVSIKFNKKSHSEEGGECTTPRVLKGSVRSRGKPRGEETDVTTSERERTNSVSSRASSGAPGSGRRKLSVSSNRTFVNDEKIPWCGCWGNGCV